MDIGVSDNIETDGGISLHITNRFLKTIKNQVIDSLIEAFKPQEVNMVDTYNLSLFNFTYNVTDLTMHAFDMDYEASTVEFRDTDPHIYIEFIDFQMDLVFNYSLYANPLFYLDEGPGRVTTNFQNVSIGLDLVEVDGKFQFKVFDIFANYTGGLTKFGGQGDISYVLNTVAETLRNSFFADASGTIRGIVEQALPLINGQLQGGGCTQEYMGLFFSWCAMEQPQFNGESVSLIFKGETRYDNDIPIPFEDKRKVPYVVEDGKDIQLSVSDYFLNTTVYSAYEKGLLDFEISQLDENTTLTAGTLKPIFSDITKYMNESQPISIRFTANQTQIPYLEIIDGVTKGFGLVDIDFYKITGEDREIFLELTSHFNATIDLEIQTGFKVLTNIKQLKIKAKHLTMDKYGLTNLEDLNSMIGLISGFARNYANDALSGYSNPTVVLIPGLLKMDISDTNLFERERYIYLDSRPQFSHDFAEGTVKAKNKLLPYEKKEVTHEEQVDALASLLKLTPIYQSIQDFHKNRHIYEGLANINPAGRNYMRMPEKKESVPLEREDAELEVM